MPLKSCLYEEDFHAWCMDQISFLEMKELERLDWAHLVEELRSLGASERQDLENRLTVLIVHLLMWLVQKGFRSKIKEHIIQDQRERIYSKIQQCPSLEKFISAISEDAYRRAHFVFLRETGYHEDLYPKKIPFTLEQVLERNWLPE